MCDPISLVGLALSAGSSVMQGMAANDAAKARSSALEAERTRQRGLEAQQGALSSESQQTMANFQGDQDARAADLTAYYQAPVAADANAESGMQAPEGTSSISVREMNKQSEKATDKTNATAANRANMQSFGDLLGDKMRGIQRNSSAIDQMTGFRRGSSDALAYELEAAAQKGAGKRLLGDIMGGAGSIASGYGAMTNAGNQTVTNSLGRLTGRGAAAPAAQTRPRANPFYL